MIFEIAPEKFSPSFYNHLVKGKTSTIVDEWCSGFLQGIALADDAGPPLLDEKSDILGPSGSLPRRKDGQDWMQRWTGRRCMRSGPVILHQQSALYMPIGYLIEKLLQKTCHRLVPVKLLQEIQRWGAMRLAPLGAERNTNIAVVPEVHYIDPTAGNA